MKIVRADSSRLCMQEFGCDGCDHWWGIGRDHPKVLRPAAKSATRSAFGSSYERRHALSRSATVTRTELHSASDSCYIETVSRSLDHNASGSAIRRRRTDSLRASRSLIRFDSDDLNYWIDPRRSGLTVPNPDQAAATHQPKVDEVLS
jgi:hypothetical protein